MDIYESNISKWCRENCEKEYERFTFHNAHPLKLENTKIYKCNKAYKVVFNEKEKEELLEELKTKEFNNYVDAMDLLLYLNTKSGEKYVLYEES